MADNDNNLVFTVSSDMTAAQRGLTKFVGDIGTATTQIAKKYEQAGTKIDSSISGLQARINGMVGLGAKASKEWTGALADQGKELERLRARYSPLFATINQYKTAVADIKRAHALGAISANEMATAISKERQAALASTAAIKGRNAALAATPVQRRGASGFNTSNLAAQGFDIVATAGAMPWQTVTLQQGPQVAQVFNDIRASGQKIGPAVAGAFMQLVNPISLVTIGLIAGGVAAYQYFSSVSDGGPKSAEELKKQADLVQSLAERWGDVIPALREYANELARAQDAADVRQGASLVNEKTLEGVRKGVEDTRAVYAAFVADLHLAGEEPEVVKQFEDAFQKFAEAAEEGKVETADVQKVQDALAAALASSGIPAISEFKKAFDDLAASAEMAAGSVGKVNNAASRDIPMSAWRSFNPQTGKLETNPSIGDENIQNPGFLTPEIGPVPGRRPNIELEGLPGADKANEKAETAAQKAANAYRDLQKAADDRIGQVKQEIDLLGKYGTEADAARFALDLLQQSEDKGRSLSEAQRAELEKKVALYKQYSDALAQAKLSQDLASQARFSSLSKEDQQITTTLRQYGLPEDLGGAQAGQIRASVRMQNQSDAIDHFSDNLSSAIVNSGGDIGKAFGQTFLSALQDVAQEQLSAILKTGIKALLSGTGLSGSSAGGASTGIGGAIASAVTSAVSGKAPAVGAVTRAPIGDIASYISAAAAKRGIDPDVALRVAKSEGGLSSWNLQSNYMKNGVREPSFGPFQLYKGGGLGNAFMAKTGLDPALATNGPAGVDFALDHAAKNGWGAWYGAGKAGIGNMQGIGVGSGVNDAAAAVNKLADSAGAATTGLTTFGGGLGQLGQSLSGAFPAAPQAGGGGGGLFSWLGGLFGGGAFKPVGAQAGLAAAGGIGLYADGGHVSGAGGPTDDSIPAMLSNGEFVINSRATKKHRQLLEAINTGRVARFASGGLVSPRLVSGPSMPSLSPRGQAPGKDSAGGTLNVHVYGANGDDHVKTLVKQGVGQALGDYNKQQQRGGFGEDQRRFSNRKG